MNDQSSLDQNTDFDSFLRKQLQQAQPYLMDDDFTQNIMAKLPAPKRLSKWQERLIIAVPLVIISLLILSQFSLLGAAVAVYKLLVTLDFAKLMTIGMVSVMLVVSGASYWVAKQSKLL